MTTEQQFFEFLLALERENNPIKQINCTRGIYLLLRDLCGATVPHCTYCPNYDEGPTLTWKNEIRTLEIEIAGSGNIFDIFLCNRKKNISRSYKPLQILEAFKHYQRKS